MKKIFLMFVMFTAFPLCAFEINENPPEKISVFTRHPCPPTRYVNSDCDVRVSLGAGENVPLKHRDQIDMAKKLCLTFPSVGERVFTTQQADGDGVVFVCRFNREQFLKWWNKEMQASVRDE